MVIKEVIEKSPLRILEESIHGGLGSSNIGVFAGKASMGKTACLVYLALDALIQKKKVLHLSFSNRPNHILSWYDNIFHEFAKDFNIDGPNDIKEELKNNRLIMNFDKSIVKLSKIRNSIEENCETLNFKPDIIIIDGYEFESSCPENIDNFKRFAKYHNTEIWFSYFLSDEESDCKDCNIPESLEKYIALFSVIIKLYEKNEDILIKLVRAHSRICTEKPYLKLNPKNFLINENI